MKRHHRSLLVFIMGWLIHGGFLAFMWWLVVVYSGASLAEYAALIAALAYLELKVGKMEERADR